MIRNRRFSWRMTTIAAGVALLCLTAGTAQAGKATTLRNVERTPHFAPEGASRASLAQAIEMAGISHGWTLDGENGDGVQLSTLIRSHRATVFVGFDEEYFWIDYVNSHNLNYSPNDRKIKRIRNRTEVVKGPVIHPNYNRWVTQLADGILATMRNPPLAKQDQSIPAQGKQATSADDMRLVADELEKLDALRQRGVLTDAEFDAMKARLLGL